MNDYPRPTYTATYWLVASAVSDYLRDPPTTPLRLYVEQVAAAEWDRAMTFMSGDRDWTTDPDDLDHRAEQIARYMAVFDEGTARPAASTKGATR